MFGKSLIVLLKVLEKVLRLIPIDRGSAESDSDSSPGTGWVPTASEDRT